MPLNYVIINRQNQSNSTIYLLNKQQKIICLLQFKDFKTYVKDRNKRTWPLVVRTGMVKENILSLFSIAEVDRLANNIPFKKT